MNLFNLFVISMAFYGAQTPTKMSMALLNALVNSMKDNENACSWFGMKVLLTDCERDIYANFIIGLEALSCFTIRDTFKVQCFGRSDISFMESCNNYLPLDHKTVASMLINADLCETFKKAISEIVKLEQISDEVFNKTDAIVEEVICGKIYSSPFEKVVLPSSKPSDRPVMYIFTPFLQSVFALAVLLAIPKTIVTLFFRMGWDISINFVLAMNFATVGVGIYKVMFTGCKEFKLAVMVFIVWNVLCAVEDVKAIKKLHERVDNLTRGAHLDSEDSEEEEAKEALYKVQQEGAKVKTESEELEPTRSEVKATSRDRSVQASIDITTASLSQEMMKIAADIRGKPSDQ